MHRFSDPARSADGSRKRRQRYCLPPVVRASAPRPDLSFRGSIAQPARTPTDASPPPSRTTDARLGATVDRYSFDVELSHLLLHAGLSRRRHNLTKLYTTKQPLWRPKRPPPADNIASNEHITNRATTTTMLAPQRPRFAKQPQPGAALSRGRSTCRCRGDTSGRDLRAPRLTAASGRSPRARSRST